MASVLRYPAADQLQGWLDLILGKPVHQLMEFLAHRAHRRILWSTDVSGAYAAPLRVRVNEVLAGVVEIHDLGGLGKLRGGDVPDLIPVTRLSRCACDHAV